MWGLQSPEPVRASQRWGNRAASPHPCDPAQLGGWGPQERPVWAEAPGGDCASPQPLAGWAAGTSARWVTLGPVNPTFASRLKVVPSWPTTALSTAASQKAPSRFRPGVDHRLLVVTGDQGNPRGGTGLPCKDKGGHSPGWRSRLGSLGATPPLSPGFPHGPPHAECKAQAPSGPGQLGKPPGRSSLWGPWPASWICLTSHPDDPALSWA